MMDEWKDEIVRHHYDKDLELKKRVNSAIRLTFE
jgi:hypothetical protein